jgi:hypothetical protein
MPFLGAPVARARLCPHALNLAAPKLPASQPSAASKAIGALVGLLLFGPGHGCPVGWESKTFSHHPPTELHCYMFLGSSLRMN